ncbi:exopolyphosphatase [Geomonas silvestris]|uniref:Exopolyphosphatase n=1 Tax=Geomonas silvestris TaxID=2740184 RepID=A0A6V8MIX0_9BACT|nr:exopolyphosphatase [Geomonas silvestris]GFO59931.1 exopolyphosphatase [Geomonas silvestris]
MNQPVAAIDLGTNTARLLIATLEPFQQILLQRTITRLGGGFSRERGLSSEAMQRSLAALAGFAEEIQRHQVVRLRAVATSAVRDAVNGAEFCARVKELTGIELEVIDGHLEALFTLAGVSSVLDHKERDLAVFDIGGGSTEYTLSRRSEPLFSRSLPLGVVRLTEGKGDVDQMQDKIARELFRLKRDLEGAGLEDDFAQSTLVGTAGTATTLAAIQLKMTDYDYRKVNNCVVSQAQVQEIFELLLPMTPAQRLEVVGLEPGREDLIIAGTLVVLETMRIFGFDSLTVSDSGLLEGLLLEG